MAISPTLTLYIGRRFVAYFAAVFVPAAGLTWMIDAVELSRRASARASEIGFATILTLATFKCPVIIEELFPFLTLLAAIITFWRLTRDQELVVVRAAGVSVWRFVLPVMLAALLVGAFKLCVWNPMAAALYARFERLSATLIDGVQRSVALGPAGFWVRQQEAGTTSIIHARRVMSERLDLADVTVFNFVLGDRFVGRVDAASGRLEGREWLFEDAVVSLRDQPSRRVPSVRLPTSFTIDRIQETFAPYESVSVWQMPEFIELLESAGFPATRHLVHFQRVMASPLLMLSVVLIAATFSLRLPRRGGAAILLAVGIVAGFLIFLVSNIVVALGRGGLLPSAVAAWTPPLVWLLLAMTALFYLEDG